MRSNLHTAACALAVGLGALAFTGTPVTAQTMPRVASNASSTTTNADSRGPNGSLEKYHGMLRASELTGANVYNDQGTVIGTVNDMLMGDDGKIQNVVISVGGFLGVGTHYVSVPFSQLKVQPSRSPGAGIINPNGTLPGMTGTATAAGATAGTGPATTAPIGTTPATAAHSTPTGSITPGATSGTMAPALPANGSSMTAARATMQYFSVVLPGATKDSLTKMPEFHYTG